MNNLSVALSLQQKPLLTTVCFVGGSSNRFQDFQPIVDVINHARLAGKAQLLCEIDREDFLGGVGALKNIVDALSQEGERFQIDWAPVSESEELQAVNITKA